MKLHGKVRPVARALAFALSFFPLIVSAGVGPSQATGVSEYHVETLTPVAGEACQVTQVVPSILPEEVITFTSPVTSPTLAASLSLTFNGTLTPTVTATPANTVIETTTLPDDVNPLTGLKVSDKSVLRRRPLLVRIGNDPQIRPQTGLSGADLVYEDIMDGWWVTRLTGIYLSQDLESVGPVRSARLVNLQMAPLYDGALVHSGASDPIRWRLSHSGIVDLDEFFNRTPYFYKPGADWRGRLFVNLKLMREYLRQKNLEKAVPLRGFTFDAPGAAVPAGWPAIEFTIPFPKNSVVRFKYNPGSGLYERFVQDRPHLDAATKQQLAVANVVVQFCPHEKTDIVEDSQGTTSINITLVGEGPALIFRDGVAIQGRWKTADARQMPLFVDNVGHLIPFKPGQTWIELVPPDYTIAVVPAGPLGPSVAPAAALTGTAMITATATAPMILPTIVLPTPISPTPIVLPNELTE